MAKVSRFGGAIICMLVGSVCSAQVGSDWAEVQRLPLGTKVTVQLLAVKISPCEVEAVSEASLSCRTRTGLLKVTSHVVVPRAQVHWIAPYRTGLRSVLPLIGAGAGVVAGVANGGSTGLLIGAGAAAIFALLGYLVALAIEAVPSRVPRSAIYRMP